MYCLKMINLLDFFDIIYSGTIPHFVQFFSLIGIIKKGTDLVFKPHVFLSFGKVQFQQTKVKKMPKLSARANQMLIGVPILKHEPGTDLTNFSQIFTSLHYSKTNKNFQVFHDTSKKQDQVPDQSDFPNHF